MFMSAERLSQRLKQVFGYDEFRPLQREIMEDSLAGRDVMAILPTGAGKSLCYQLPALVREGLTLVVSPLIALMKDQVDQMAAAGVRATFLNSTLDPMEAEERLAGLARGHYQLLYVAPERLMLNDFLAQLKAWKVSALAVDEAHCISEWGHDFRPEYRRLREVRQWTGEIPILALTATATERVRGVILKQLELKEPSVFLASFNRPNLRYQVVAKSRPIQQVGEFAKSRPEDSGIVYCQSRKNTEAYAASLQAMGLKAVAYHAGLDPAQRARNQDAFLRDEARIVCATVAFGMGINKSNVRYVIHADMPKNLEGYYQETGRAGRDGLPADCLLLFSRADFMKYVKFLDDNPDEQARKVAHAQLDQMVHFAEHDACRRVGLLGYFGETWPLENCGGCDHCLEPREKWDATIDVQKLLSCVLRIRQAGGFSVGINHLAEVLTGGMSEKIQRFKHDQLKTHGIGKDQPRAYWVDLGRQLLREGLLAASEGMFATVSVSHAGVDLLKTRATLMLTRSLTSPQKAPSAPRAGDIPCDGGLFEALRVLRKEMADARGLPPYIIFSDVTLRHFCREYPRDARALLSLPGVGEKKSADYGPDFLHAILEWVETHGTRTFSPLPVAFTQSAPAKNANALNDSVYETLTLWRAENSVSEIARIRNLAETTIEGHLAQAILSGEEFDTRNFYTTDEEAEMAKAFEGYTEIALKPIFEHLGGKIGYGKLRIHQALSRRTQEMQAVGCRN